MTTANLLNEYKNGNYSVKIYEDGTKIRETEHENFIPEFPESIDIKITNRCDIGCSFCHENSRIDGFHCSFEYDIIKPLEGLPQGIELAIGGGNPLSHTELNCGLSDLQEKGFICNITINERHLLSVKQYKKTLIRLQKEEKIHGVGISLTDYDYEKHLDIKHRVFHCIVGIHDFDKIKSLIANGENVLVLGYKNYGRGEYLDKSEKIKFWKNNVWKLLLSGKVNFDNLAIEQLVVKKHVSDALWNKHYMGDDGKFSMYYDAVNNDYAKSSISQRYGMYPFKDKIINCFKNLQNSFTPI